MRVGVVDIDVHYGNGTADVTFWDQNAFFGTVQMVYGERNDGNMVGEAADGSRGVKVGGFYPPRLGVTEIRGDDQDGGQGRGECRYVSVGVLPAHPQGVLDKFKKREEEQRQAAGAGQNQEDDASIMSVDGGEEDKTEGDGHMDVAAAEETQQLSTTAEKPAAEPMSTPALPAADFVGPEGYLRALGEVVIPRLEAFSPDLLIISAGFDGYVSDPLGSELGLSLEHYTQSTCMLTACMDRVARKQGRTHGMVLSLLEGGYDTSSYSLGLARCVDAHVSA
eukprot:gene48703-59629_t